MAARRLAGLKTPCVAACVKPCRCRPTKPSFCLRHSLTWSFLLSHMLLRPLVMIEGGQVTRQDKYILVKRRLCGFVTFSSSRCRRAGRPVTRSQSRQWRGAQHCAGSGGEATSTESHLIRVEIFECGVLGEVHQDPSELRWRTCVGERLQVEEKRLESQKKPTRLVVRTS